MDSHTAFPLYWAPAVASARALVDELMNCDDLLLNFVLANVTRAEAEAAGSDTAPQPRRQTVHWVRPERRIDVSKLSGVGISHDFAKFKQSADRCLTEFAELFGGSPLQRQAFSWSRALRKPSCGSPLLGCVYL